MGLKEEKKVDSICLFKFSMNVDNFSMNLGRFV